MAHDRQGSESNQQKLKDLPPAPGIDATMAPAVPYGYHWQPQHIPPAYNPSAFAAPGLDSYVDFEPAQAYQPAAGLQDFRDAPAAQAYEPDSQLGDFRDMVPRLFNNPYDYRLHVGYQLYANEEITTEDSKILINEHLNALLQVQSPYRAKWSDDVYKEFHWARADILTKFKDDADKLTEEDQPLDIDRLVNLYKIAELYIRIEILNAEYRTEAQRIGRISYKKKQKDSFNEEHKLTRFSNHKHNQSYCTHIHYHPHTDYFTPFVGGMLVSDAINSRSSGGGACIPQGGKSSNKSEADNSMLVIIMICAVILALCLYAVYHFWKKANEQAVARNRNIIKATMISGAIIGFAAASLFVKFYLFDKVASMFLASTGAVPSLGYMILGAALFVSIVSAVCSLIADRIGRGINSQRSKINLKLLDRNTDAAKEQYDLEIRLLEYEQRQLIERYDHGSSVSAPVPSAPPLEEPQFVQRAPDYQAPIPQGLNTWAVFAEQRPVVEYRNYFDYSDPTHRAVPVVPPVPQHPPAEAPAFANHQQGYQPAPPSGSPQYQHTVSPYGTPVPGGQ